MDENNIGTRVIGCAIEVHRELGPGLLESVYQRALAIELADAGLRVAQEVPVQVRYKGRELDEGFRADLIVEDAVILELKAVEALKEVHKKQLQTYLKLTGRRLGYLLNFNAPAMRQGIIRCVNGAEEFNPK
jgi:GxxExxY protein